MPNEDLNLVPAIRAIEGQINELKNEYVKKITPYKESLASSRRLTRPANHVAEQEKCLGVHAQKTKETTIHAQTVRDLANV